LNKRYLFKEVGYESGRCDMRHNGLAPWRFICLP
jgi:hypothetical protein